MGRSTKTRKLKNAVAIVGEGRSEWHYFTAMKQIKRYSFKVLPELPSNASVAAIIAKSHSLIDDGYDKVFCVLDLDVSYKDAASIKRYVVQKKKAIRKSKGQIEFIESMPCFELWFLIHFIDYSTREYMDYNSLKPQLKKVLPDYEKSENFFRKANFYNRLLEQGSIGKAATTASKLLMAFKRSDSPTHPRTSVHELLAFLDLRNKSANAAKHDCSL